MRIHARFGLLAAWAALAIITAAPGASAANGRKGALLGGLAIGGVAGALLMQSARPGYAAPPPVIEDEEEVVYSRPRVRYEPTCQMVRKKVWLDAETYTYRRVEICE